MNLKLLIHTLRHLRLRQVCYQVRYRLQKPKYAECLMNRDVVRCELVEWVEKWACCDGDSMDFINIRDVFKGWDDRSNGMLWAYNLNYMDWLNQPNMPYEIGARWIDDFIHKLPSNSVGQDPYPIALRAINWIKFITKYWGDIPAVKRTEWCNSLYSQYRLLIKKLEYHLMGNHLLEDVFSLFIGAIFFADAKMYRRAERLLRQELDEQILQDGAHYEQSVMYHLILLDRLLDCHNFAVNNIRFENQSQINDFLRQKAELMLGHLDAVRYDDGSFPMFNDAALGIAPTVSAIFDYAKRLNIGWKRIALSDSGYRRLQNGCFEATVDVGNVMATYQPGHTHADTLNYELRINGNAFVVDTGISTYNKTERRQYERSSMAHNVVTIGGRDSSEVWGSFRVGRRAEISIFEDSGKSVKASHNGYSGLGNVKRRFEIADTMFVVEDILESGIEAVSWIHFAPNIEVDVFENKLTTKLADIVVIGANKIEIIENTISEEYNKFKSIKVAKLYFTSNLICNICKH